MRDPEIVFNIEDGEWTAIEITDDPTPPIYRRSETGLKDVQDHADNTWGPNIRNQGFVDQTTNGNYSIN